MKAIILAAGQSKRMRSSTPKVLHPIMGKPLLQYMPEACQKAGISDITLVISRSGDAIRNAIGEEFDYAIQDLQLGTGHAVQAAAGHINDDDDVLVMCGDMPLITAEFIQEFRDFYHAKDCAGAVAAVYQPDSKDLGRVYASENGMFEAIIEARDLKPGHPHTEWVNTGIMFFKGASLLQGLKHMTNQNSQGEFYLTDVPKILRDMGQMFYVFHTRDDVTNFTGINTQAQLAEAARYMRDRINMHHMENGVRMLDPATTYIDAAVEIASDVIIYPGCILEGACKIESGAIIGPYTHMQDTEIAKNASVRQSVLKSAKIGQSTEVGPFAYLRPGAVVGNNCRIGNFVEIKNATLGEGTKMAHLAYIGDAEVGRNVNYSCGAITANYDGKNKHRTVIADRAFIGCNANLVAPVEIGEEAVVAAGSTITDNLPGYSMGIARERQTTKDNWVKQRKG